MHVDISALLGKHPGIMCDIYSGHLVGKGSDIDSDVLFGKILMNLVTLYLNIFRTFCLSLLLTFYLASVLVLTLRPFGQFGGAI